MCQLFLFLGEGCKKKRRKEAMGKEGQERMLDFSCIIFFSFEGQSVWAGDWWDLICLKWVYMHVYVRGSGMAMRAYVCRGIWKEVMKWGVEGRLGLERRRGGKWSVSVKWNKHMRAGFGACVWMLVCASLLPSLTLSIFLKLSITVITCVLYNWVCCAVRGKIYISICKNVLAFK